MSVTTLLSLDRPGLFHRAIMQSGAGHCAQTKEDAALVTQELAKRLNVEQPTAEAFAELELTDILAAQDDISNEVAATPDQDKWGESTVMSGMAFLPVIDGELLTQRPIDAIAAGAGRNVPVLTGTNTEEYRLFLAPIAGAFLLREDFYKNKLTPYGIDTGVPGVYDFYKSRLPTGTKPAEIFSAIASDFFFRIPACRVAEARTAAPATTHMYEFTWRSPRKAPNQLFPELGACHALELGFMFDTLSTAHSITGPTPPQGLATAIHAAWVDFVKSGDPGWIPYDTTTRPVQTFSNAGQITIVNDPRAPEREKWTDFVTP